jgi:hypothetical protein
MEIYPSEILGLVAWFCGPAILLTLGGESVFFRQNDLFRKRLGTVLLAYLLTIALVPAGSIALLLVGLGESPLNSPITIHRSSGNFIVPWFWQSFIAAAVVGVSILAVVKRIIETHAGTPNIG